jgi:hypothetical protein
LNDNDREYVHGRVVATARPGTEAGATTGDTIYSPYQAGTDHDDENAAWVAEVEAKGYVPCPGDEVCNCQGTTFGIVYHTPAYLEAERERARRNAAAEDDDEFSF